MERAIFPASKVGLVDIEPEKNNVGTAEKLLNLIPRDRGLYIRKGLKFHAAAQADERLRYLTLIPHGDKLYVSGSNIAEVTDQATLDNKLPTTFDNPSYANYTDLEGTLNTVIVGTNEASLVSIIGTADPVAVTTAKQHQSGQLRLTNERPAGKRYAFVWFFQAGASGLDKDGVPTVNNDKVSRSVPPKTATFSYNDGFSESIEAVVDGVTHVWGSDRAAMIENLNYIRSQDRLSNYMVWEMYAVINDADGTIDSWSRPYLLRMGELDDVAARAAGWNAPDDAPTFLTNEPFYEILKNKNTSDFSFALEYQNRLLFLEGPNTVWYTRDSNTNVTATTIMDKFIIDVAGGKVQSMFTVSNDTGEGPDDYVCFVTDTGKLFLYNMPDISNPDAISYVGRFDIGIPQAGPKSHTAFNGDVVIATEWGYVSVWETVKTGVVTGRPDVAGAIQDTWRELIDQYPTQWYVQSEFNTERIILIRPGNAPFCLCWTVGGGWSMLDIPVRSVAIHKGKMWITTDDYSIYTYEGGCDEGSDSTKNTIYGHWIPKPSLLNNVDNKQMKQCKVRYNSLNRVNYDTFCYDFDDPRIPSYPEPAKDEGDFRLGDNLNKPLTPAENIQYSSLTDAGNHGELLCPGLVFATNTEQYLNTQFTSIVSYFEHTIARS